MNRLLLLKQKLKNKQNILSTTITCTLWSGIIQKLGKMSFDLLIFDLEHGILNTENIEESLRVCRLVDMPSVVRVADTVPHLISKAIDMGADGLLIPRVESVMQVEMAVRSMRFAPKGRKGCGGFSLFRENEQFDQINDNRLLFIQIESDEGIECLPSILERFKQEISAVIIGPYDMSIMSSVPMDTTCALMLKRISSIFKMCSDCNISCGIFVDNANDIEKWKQLGANIFWTGSELSLLCESCEQLCLKFEEISMKKSSQ